MELENTSTEIQHFHNVAVYIDYENVHKTLIRQYQNVIRLGFFEKLRKWCKENGKRIVNIYVYCNFDVKDLYEGHHQSFLQNYGVETIHTSNQGKNYADLKLTIDILNVLYSNTNIDEFIIMSNDKDMIPLLNTIRTNKRTATILTTGTSYNPSLHEFADDHITFEEIIDTELDCSLIVEQCADEQFLYGIVKHTEKALEELNEEKLTNPNARYKRHYHIDYFLPAQASYVHLMPYEIYNSIKSLCEKGRLIIYKSPFKDNNLALLPTEFKEMFISNNFMCETDITDISVIEPMQIEKYNSYFSKNELDT